MLTFDGLVIIHNGDWLVDRKKYRVYINSPHGTVTATPKKGFPGTVVTLTNEPDLGYDFSSYTVQGATLSGNTFVIDHQDVYVTGNFSLHDYTITVTQPSGGTISAPSTAHYGDTVTLTSIPSAGYELDYFIVDGQPIEGNTFVMPASDVTITAAYKLATYTISITQVANGTIYASAATAHMGDSITLTSSPATHYALNYYTVDGSQIQGNTFTMPASDVVVSGAFTAATYTISVTQPEGGTISAPATATYGQTVTITNSPNSGWQFDHYTVNGQAISGNTFTCTGNTIVGAVFNNVGLHYTTTYMRARASSVMQRWTNIAFHIENRNNEIEMNIYGWNDTRKEWELYTGQNPYYPQNMYFEKASPVTLYRDNMGYYNSLNGQAYKDGSGPYYSYPYYYFKFEWNSKSNPGLYQAATSYSSSADVSNIQWGSGTNLHSKYPTDASITWTDKMGGGYVPVTTSAI